LKKKREFARGLRQGIHTDIQAGLGCTGVEVASLKIAVAGTSNATDPRGELKLGRV
jgi:hypothetical protein